MRLNPPRSTRRSILAGLAVLGIAAVQRAFPPAEKVSLAQDATPAAVATPAPSTSTIQSTGIGAVPSTGGSRPGPVSQVRERITVEAIHGNRGRLTLASHGRRLEIGRFLTLDEKRELARALEEALRSVR